MNESEKKVLVIERDSGIANMIRAILAIVKVPVIHVQQHAEARAILKTESIGMIICESSEPVKAGVSLMNEVRENAATAQIPFLMLVPDERHVPKESGTEQRADRYIVKPFTARGVLDVVKEFIVYKNL